LLAEAKFTIEARTTRRIGIARGETFTIKAALGVSTRCGATALNDRG
jgi:hypothetical protein